MAGGFLCSSAGLSLPQIMRIFQCWARMHDLESFGGRDAGGVGLRSVLRPGRWESCGASQGGIACFLKIRVSHGRGFWWGRPGSVGETCGEVGALNRRASSLKAAGGPAPGAAGPGGGGRLGGGQTPSAGAMARSRPAPGPAPRPCSEPPGAGVGGIRWTLRGRVAAKRSIPAALPGRVAVALRMFSLLLLPGEERMAS